MDSSSLAVAAFFSIMRVIEIVLFAGLFVESLSLVRRGVPGTAIAVLIASVAGARFREFDELYWLACLAAMTGSSISYELGRREAKGGPGRFHRNASRGGRLGQAETRVRRSRMTSVFLARFHRSDRASVPYAAGTAAVGRLAFYPIQLIGVTFALLVYLGFGYAAGAALAVAMLWSSSVAWFMGFLIAGVVLIAWLARWTVHHRRSLSAFFASLSGSVVHAVGENAHVQQWSSEHPKLVAFAKSRFSRHEFRGLPLSLLVAMACVLLFLLSGLLEEYVRRDPLVSMDVRLSNLVARFRERHLVTVFYWISFFGSVITVIASALLTCGFLMWRKAWSSAVGLGGGIAIGSVAMAAAKQVFQRARPERLLSVVEPGSYSFPSGHATAIAALYALITYLVIRLTPSVREKAAAVVVAVVTVLAVDLSRIYLGVHYLSDVLMGNVVGLLAALTGVALCEWWQTRSRSVVRLPRFGFSGVFLAVTILLVVTQAAVQAPPQLPDAAQPSLQHVKLGAVPELFDRGKLPRRSETILGEPQEPISLILIAKDERALTGAFAQAGWKKADRLTLQNYWKVWRSAMLRKPYPTAPMSPSFYDAQPHDLGFEKTTERRSAEQRHHLRLWKTRYTTGRGRVFLGTASRDVGVKWGITHQIAPDIDTERDFVVQDLQAAGVVRRKQMTQMVPPALGENFTGSPFFTYGEAAELVLISEADR